MLFHNVLVSYLKLQICPIKKNNIRFEKHTAKHLKRKKSIKNLFNVALQYILLKSCKVVLMKKKPIKIYHWQRAYKLKRIMNADYITMSSFADKLI